MECFRRLLIACVLALFQDLATLQKEVEFLQSAVTTSYQYIDDRHVGQLAISSTSLVVSPTLSDFELAEAAVFICAAVLVSLGYFLDLSKSTLIPSRIAKFLGFLVSSYPCAFILPADKKEIRSIT